MTKSTVSRTAMGAAYLRAVENRRSQKDRLFADPLASDLLSPLYRGIFGISAIPGMSSLFLKRSEKTLPGVGGGILGRTCYIDETLTAALTDGIEQVVILGAGLDSRAYRIDGMQKAQVFEVDQPGTIAYKRERLEQILGELPEQVTYVPIDFDRQRLDAALFEVGFKPERRTFFIWEGVSQYLNASAVDAMLRFVTSCAAGSRIVFTYVHRGVLDPTSPLYNPDMLDRLKKLNEPWRFGLHPNQIASYLDQRGLSLVDHADATVFRERYLQPRGRDMEIMEVEFIVLAQAIGR